MVVSPKAVRRKVHAGDKHVMAPDAEAEHTDEQRREHHEAVRGDRAAREVGEDRRGEAMPGGW